MFLTVKNPDVRDRVFPDVRSPGKISFLGLSRWSCQPHLTSFSRICILRRKCLVSAPSGLITTITLQDGAPNRLVKLYRGRGGALNLEGGRGMVRFRSVG